MMPMWLIAFIVVTFAFVAGFLVGAVANEPEQPSCGDCVFRQSDEVEP